MGDSMSGTNTTTDPTRRTEVLTRHVARLSPVVAAAVGSVLALAAHAEAPPPVAATANLDEIVVTATRRQESINKIPISVSAFSQERMDEQGIKSIDDVARFTPGLTFAPSTDGLTSSIAIRGVASGVGASTTGVYIDDTPIQIRSGTGVVTENVYPQIFDLDRVEVLRGPQGTLFGTGSMGGTVRFITPEPDLHRYKGYTRAEWSSTRGGDPSYEVGVAGGGPIIDGTLGFRASAFYNDAGGFIERQPFTGSAVTEKALNYNHTTVLRAVLKWAVTDTLTITPAVSYQDVRRNDSYYWESLSNPDSSDFRTGFTQPQPAHDKFTLPSLKVDWQLGQAELISNTSFLSRELTRTSDYSNYLWFALVGDPTPRAPVADYRSTSSAVVRQNSFTQEFRLQSTEANSRLKWVVGALFQSSRLYTNQYVVDPLLPKLSEEVYGAPIEDIFGVGLVDGRYSATIDQWATDKQLALFGQLDFALTPELKGTLGARVARTSLDFNRQFGGPLLCVACTGAPEITGGSTPTTRPVTPKLGLSYEPDTRSLYYGSIAKGARVGGVNNPSTASNRPGCPGGLQAPTTYAPDSLWSYELGAKNQLANGRFRTQVSAYYIDWQDIQQSVSANGCFTSSYKDNLGKATVKGFDLGAEIRVTDQLSLSVAGGYSQARYSSTAYGAPAAGTGIRAIIAADGDSLGVAPWNATVAGDYALVAWNRPGYFRVDYTYTAKDTGVTPWRDPATNTYDPGLGADPAVRLLGARLGMTFGGLEVSVFGRNLLNDAPALGRNHDGVGDPLYYALTVRPRTFGVTGTYKF